MSKNYPALNNIETLLSHSVREQMLTDIAANDNGEVLWWGKLDLEAQPDGRKGDKPDDQNQTGDAAGFLVHFVEAAACGNEDSVLAHFPYMERGDVVLHNHPSGPVQPSSADLAVAGELSRQGIGFYIVDNRLERICVVSRPVIEGAEQLLEADTLSDLLGPDGPLPRIARETGGSYEQRPMQQDLLRMVAQAFNTGQLAVAEGGTGIGKSFAYLLPAAFWAQQNRQRVVVSTATITLQQQLIEKDIPLIREIGGLHELKAELVKGRSNYLCLRRLKQAQEGFDMDEDSVAAELESIDQWAALTKDGSLRDLGFRPQSSTWRQVCGESDNCLGLRCEFHERCFIIRARRRAAGANLLVVNHHLLFADLELRANGDFGYEKTAVLPPYRHVVIDEAHNIERSAQSFFSQSLGRFSAQRSLRRLYFRQRNRERGIWAQLRYYVELEEESEVPDIPGCSEALEGAFAALESAAGAVMEVDRRASLRIPEQWPSLEVAAVLQRQLWPSLERLRSAFAALLAALHRVSDLLEDSLDTEGQNLLTEWKLLARRLEALRDTVLQWLDLGKKTEPAENTTEQPAEWAERVFWLEKRAGRAGENTFRLLSTQMDIGDILQHVLYEPLRTVVMVSATLRVGSRFDYWCSRVGLGGLLGGEGFCAAAYPSPFDYQNRVKLLLATDAPSPNFNAQFQDYIARFAHQAIRSMGGRSLLLFTSYAALNGCYEVLLENGELDLLRQGDDENSRLLEQFKNQEHLSLLATDSFWEGVDAPGPTLSQVLLCRLPFRSPDDPIVAAHTELLERRGENAFFRYSLPEAILRFRQGFGRLMRRGSDRGLVIVLDPRLVSKRYGRQFLSSLPPAQVVRGDFATLQNHIQHYAQTCL